MLRKSLSYLALAGAALFASLPSATAEPAAIVVEISEPKSANLKATPPADSDPSWSTLLEMSEASAVLSTEMLLVSAVIEKVELAREPKGARKVAQGLAKEKYGWGSYQFSCLNTLWTKESNWNYRARNPRTGAHGIPQALPATKMEIISSDWRTNPVTQIQWGLHYIDVRYETPCRALAKFKRSRYY